MTATTCICMDHCFQVQTKLYFQPLNHMLR